MVVERLRLARVERNGAQRAGTVRFHHGLGGRCVDVTQCDVIIPRLGEQTTDESADLAGTQDQNFVHEYLD